MLTIAIPVGVAIAGIYVLYGMLTSTIKAFHLLMVGGSAVLLVLAIALAGAGVALHWCLLVVALVPWVTVVGYEVRGHQHNEEVLQALQ